nr:DUF2490 domain-containing protein [Allomuricauda sp.]
MGCAKHLVCLSLLYIFWVWPQTVLIGQPLNDDHSDSWFILYADSKLSGQWRIPTIGIIRYHDIFDNREFSFLSSGLSYKNNNNCSYTIGFAYLNAVSNEESISETQTRQYWVFESFTIKHQLRSSRIDQRLRLESRWISNASQTNFTNRVRYRFQYLKPIHKRIYLKFFDEIFVNVDTVGFNQNRLYLGMGQHISNSISLDLGYLKNHFPTQQRDVIRMCLTVRTDFSKKELAMANGSSSK